MRDGPIVGPPGFWLGMSVIGRLGIGLGDGVFGSAGIFAAGMSVMSLAGGPLSRPPSLLQSARGPSIWLTVTRRYPLALSTGMNW